MNLEERIEAAIVAKFFEPSVMIQPYQVVDPQTGLYKTETGPTQMVAPMSIVAEAIYRQAQPEIIRKVVEQLDMDAIIAEWAPIIAKDVITQLQKTPERWSSNPTKSEREKMLAKVYEAVAEEFGRQCVEHLKNTGGLLNVLEAASET